MKRFQDFKSEALKDSLVKQAYDELAPDFAIAEAVIGKRLEQGMTQAELAAKVGTKQSAISRLESGRSNPSVSFLEKVAKALNLRLRISFSR